MKPKYYSPYNLDERDEDKNTTLYVAIHCNSLPHLTLLLQAVASPHWKDSGSTPIHKAISMGIISQHRTFACEAVDVLM